MVNVLIAPNAFKGSITASEFCDVVTEAFQDAGIKFNVASCPLADGGDGTAAILANHLNYEKVYTDIVDPIGRKIRVPYYLRDNKALLSIADASGLWMLAKEEQNPFLTTTYGFGQLIKHVIAQGIYDLIICLGGSSTVDGGIGLLSALGVKFLDVNDKDIFPITVADIDAIKLIDLDEVDPIFKQTKIQLLCDVDNLLVGDKGAAKIFGPQKGADNEGVIYLEGLMSSWLTQLEIITQKKLLCKSSGAAGGVGVGLSLLFHVEYLEGSKIIVEWLGVEALIEHADLVITGEGCFDDQSMMGKITGWVMETTMRYKKQIFLCVGEYKYSGEVDNYEHLELIELTPHYEQSNYSIQDIKNVLSQEAKSYVKKKYF